MSDKLKTVKIKGKDYVEVNERIKHFRSKYQKWSINTKIVELTSDRVVMSAMIVDDEGKVRSTGHAFEDKGSTFINKTSFIENCETSVIGRALGNFGIGIDTSIASFEEVQGAITQQEELADEHQISLIETLLVHASISVKQEKDIDSRLTEFTYKEASECIKFLRENQAEKTPTSQKEIANAVAERTARD